MVAQRPSPIGLAAFALILVAAGCCEEPAPDLGEDAGTTTGEVVEPVTEGAEVSREAFLAMARKGFVDQVDAERGLLEVEYASDPAGEWGHSEDDLVKVARRLCGRPLSLWNKKTGKWLSQKLEWAEEGVTCEGAVCQVGATGEYDVDSTYHFVAGDDGEPVLDRVVSIEGGPVVESFRKEGRRWADAQVEALGDSRCGQDKPEVNRWFYQVCNTRNDDNPGLPMRSEPSWGGADGLVRGADGMRDGTLVEDLGGREGEWWRVRHADSGNVGWVVSRNVDEDSPQHKDAVLCPVK